MPPTGPDASSSSPPARRHDASQPIIGACVTDGDREPALWARSTAVRAACCATAPPHLVAVALHWPLSTGPAECPGAGPASCGDPAVPPPPFTMTGTTAGQTPGPRDPHARAASGTRQERGR
jgi:hypothetical protein